MKRFVSLLLVLCLLPVFGAVPQAEAAGRFSDITDKDTAEAAELLYQLKIVSGTGGSSYSPNGLFDRATLAVIGVRLSGMFDVSSYGGTVRFPDVRANHWSHKWVNAANTLGIMKGGTDGNFKPDDPMLYGALITVLMKLLGYKDEDVGLNWPQSYIAKAEALGIGVKFGANDKLTRGQAARVIRNFLFLKDKEGKVYAEKVFGIGYADALLAFDTADGVTVISAGETSYTYRGTLDTSYKGKMAKLLIDKDGNVLSVALDDTVTYKKATVIAAQSRGLETSGGGYVPVGSSVGVWEWEGTVSGYATAVGKFWQEEPVTLVYRGNTLLYILRDSHENQIGAHYVNVLLRLRASGGQTYVIAEDGTSYRVKGSIDAAQAGRMGRLLIDRDGYAVGFTAGKDYTYRTVTVSETQSNGFRDAAGTFVSVSGELAVWGEDKGKYSTVYDDIRPGETLLMAYNEAGTVQYVFRAAARGTGEYVLAVLEKQPEKGSDPITAAFGKTATGAVLYKNGVIAEMDMLEKWDVLMFYPSAGLVEASSVRVTGYYSSPRPNPTAPSSLLLMGQDFDLLPEATAKMANAGTATRWVFLLSADGRIADVRTSGEVYDTTIGLASAGGVLAGVSDFTFQGSVYGPYPLVTGRVGHFQGSGSGRIYLEPFEPRPVDGDLNLTAKKLGSAPLAPWCVFYDQVGSAGRAVRLSASDIPMNRIAASKILYAETGPAGYVTAVVLNDVTGDAYQYGFAIDQELTDSMLGGGTYTYYEMGVSPDGKSSPAEWLFAGSNDPPRRGSIVGIAAGNALNGESGTVVGVVSCVKYEGLTRYDFNGNNSVKIKGEDIALAAQTVFVPSTGETMSLTDARAYCKTFEVYTDPWGYKVRFIIGRV